MTTKSLIIFCIMLIGCLFILSFDAEAGGVGTSGSTVLKIGVGAKPTSMGEATVAINNDITSIYWNPAGLASIKNSQFSAMHIEWFDDIRYEWLGFAQPISSHVTVATDVSYLYMGAITRTIESISEGYEQDGTFSPVDIAGRLALSIEAMKGLMIGASFQRIQSQISFDKITKERISDKTAQGMAIDIGGIYYVPKIQGLSVGGCFQNFGGQTKGYITKKESIPFSFDLGLAYKAQMTNQKAPANIEGVPNSQEQKPQEKASSSSLTIALAVMFPSDESINTRLGLEYQFNNGISFRGGFRTGSSFDFPSGISAGIGYDSSAYQVDYAFVPYGDLGNTHRVSFTVRF